MYDILILLCTDVRVYVCIRVCVRHVMMGVCVCVDGSCVHWLDWVDRYRPMAARPLLPPPTHIIRLITHPSQQTNHCRRRSTRRGGCTRGTWPTWTRTASGPSRGASRSSSSPPAARTSCVLLCVVLHIYCIERVQSAPPFD